MPVQRCTNNGKKGWKYGKSGRCYSSGSDSENKKKAYVQGYAVQKSQEREGKSEASSIDKLQHDLFQRLVAIELDREVMSDPFQELADRLIRDKIVPYLEDPEAEIYTPDVDTAGSEAT